METDNSTGMDLILNYKRQILRGLFAFAALVLVSCNDEEREPFYTDSELLISSYVSQKPQYDEFYKLLELSGMKPTLDAFGTYTCFAPNNEAFKNYYAEAGISSLSDLSENEVKKLAWNHVIGDQVVTSFKFPYGVLKDTTAYGNRITTEIGAQGGLDDVTVNKIAKIVIRDIEVANGVIHEVDHLLLPNPKSVYEHLRDDSRYKIFAEALEKTGFSDTLSTIYVPNEVSGGAIRVKFTILAEPDELLAKQGINSFEDLKAKYAKDNKLTDSKNGLNKYMAYHCIKGLYYTNNFITQNYENFSDDLMSVSVDGQAFKLNEEVKDETETYNTFVLAHSNVVARNGVVHEVEKHMPVFSPKPKEYLWTPLMDPYIASLPEVAAGQNVDIKVQMPTCKWWTTLGFIRFRQGVKFNVGMKGHPFWAKFLIPKLVKGKYKIIAKIHGGNLEKRAAAQPYIDGKKLGGVLLIPKPMDYELGAVNFKTNSTHEVMFKSVRTGGFPLINIRFVPIEE
ncbi:MAG: fasciclin domain-containing protein [Cytophagales bacterium]|nr:fasciclin domain-containing protein [Cytophagales bacterium]